MTLATSPTPAPSLTSMPRPARTRSLGLLVALSLSSACWAGCMSCPNGSRPVTNPSEARANGRTLDGDQSGFDQDYVCVPNSP